MDDRVSCTQHIMSITVSSCQHYNDQPHSMLLYTTQFAESAVKKSFRFLFITNMFRFIHSSTMTRSHSHYENNMSTSRVHLMFIY